MPATYTTAVKTPRMTATRDYFANGSLEILSAGGAVLVALGLSDTGGSVANDAWTLAFDGPADAGAPAGAGVAATTARLKNSAGTVGLTGLTVGDANSTAEIKLSNVGNTTIAQGQTVTFTAATITHA